MEITLTKLCEKNLKWVFSLGIWVDDEGNIYEIKNKTAMDMVEFETTNSSEYEHTVAFETSSLFGDDI
jgi:hypothetical protein